MCKDNLLEKSKEFGYLVNKESEFHAACVNELNPLEKKRVTSGSKIIDAGQPFRRFFETFYLQTSGRDKLFDWLVANALIFQPVMHKAVKVLIPKHGGLNIELL